MSKAATFEDFWEIWPNKEAKKMARKAWDKAMREGTDPAVIIEGVETYKRKKPAWRNWMHPATFINGERWTDSYAQTPMERERDRTLEAIRGAFDGRGTAH